MRYANNPQQRRSILHQCWSLLGSSMLWLFGIFGLILTLWLTYSAATGAQLVHLKTGSMAPSLPAGSLAVTVPTPASELKPGDIITVQRDIQVLPVTHRIIEIEEDQYPSNSSHKMYTIWMKGDANQQPDFDPYRISSAGKVIAGLASGGIVIDFLQRPITMLALTGIVAVLIGYAFWPAQTRRPIKHGRYRSRKTVSPTHPSSQKYSPTSASSPTQSVLAQHSRQGTLLAVGIFATLSILTLPASHADSMLVANDWQEHPENGTAGYLVLDQRFDQNLSVTGVAAHDTIRWDFRARLEPPALMTEQASLALLLRAEGSMLTQANLLMTVESCASAFTGTLENICPTGSDTLEPQLIDFSSPADNGSGTFGTWSLGTLSGTSPVYLLVHVRVAPMEEVADTSARFGFGFTATHTESTTELSDSGYGRYISLIGPILALITGISIIAFSVMRRKWIFPHTHRPGGEKA